MARSDKDNPQKDRALKFCVSSGILTFLEIDVRTGIEFTPSSKLLTDIDVLGVDLHKNGSISKTIFDCKGTGGPPFARALWLSGLMSYVKADGGVMLMGRSAERSHRLAARQLGVRIFGAAPFDDYASAASSEYRTLTSYAGNIENWHRVVDACEKETYIKQIYQCIQQEVPISLDAPKALRRLISGVLPHKGEMNPKKPLHMAAFSELTLCISYLLGRMVGELRNIIDLSDGEKDFSTILRYYVWGGYENVESLKKMYEVLSSNDKDFKPETELVAWNHLVQIVRGLLEAPADIRNSTLALRELSLLYLADRSESADKRVARLFKEPRARQFAKRFGDYTANVLKLPKEFSDRMGAQIDDLVGEAPVNRLI